MMLTRWTTGLTSGCRTCPYGTSTQRTELDLQLVPFVDLPDGGPEPFHEEPVAGAVGFHAAGRQLAALLHEDGTVHVYGQSAGWHGPIAIGAIHPETAEIDWEAGVQSDWVDVPMGFGWTEEFECAIREEAEAWLRS